MFEVVNGAAYSLDDLHRYQARGGSVVRTAHVGNLTLGTIFLAQEGFKVLLHEHLRGSNPYYRPGYLKIKEERIRLLAKCKRRTTQLGEIRKKSVPSEILSFLSDDNLPTVRTPAALHWRVLYRMSSNFQLLSVYLGAYGSMVRDALEVVAARLPSLFGLYIDANGHDYRLVDIRGDRLIYRNQKQLTITITRDELVPKAMQYLHQTRERITHHRTAPSGLLLHDMLTLVLISMIESFEARVERNFRDHSVIHIAGKKMNSYLLGTDPTAVANRKLLQQLTEQFRKKLSWDWPDPLQFILVPSDSMERLAGTALYVLPSIRKGAFLTGLSQFRPDQPEQTQYDLIMGQKSIFFPAEARGIPLG